MNKDIIYREDAIKAINAETNWYQVTCNGKQIAVMLMVKDVNEILKKALSADKPSGEWLKFGLGRGTRILFCTNCERRIEVPLSQGDSNYDFCPNCGADMRGEKDETD